MRACKARACMCCSSWYVSFACKGCQAENWQQRRQRCWRADPQGNRGNQPESNSLQAVDILKHLYLSSKSCNHALRTLFFCLAHPCALRHADRASYPHMHRRWLRPVMAPTGTHPRRRSPLCTLQPRQRPHPRPRRPCSPGQLHGRLPPHIYAKAAHQIIYQCKECWEYARRLRGHHRSPAPDTCALGPSDTPTPAAQVSSCHRRLWAPQKAQQRRCAHSQRFRVPPSCHRGKICSSRTRLTARSQPPRAGLIGARGYEWEPQLQRGWAACRPSCITCICRGARPFQPGTRLDRHCSTKARHPHSRFSKALLFTHCTMRPEKTSPHGKSVRSDGQASVSARTCPSSAHSVRRESAQVRQTTFHRRAT
jgi:hypothetical protein